MLLLDMWHALPEPSIEVFFAVHCTAPHLTLTHDFSSIRLGGPGGCTDPTRSLAERQRRSPHD